MSTACSLLHSALGVCLTQAAYLRTNARRSSLRAARLNDNSIFLTSDTEFHEQAFHTLMIEIIFEDFP